MFVPCRLKNEQSSWRITYYIMANNDYSFVVTSQYVKQVYDLWFKEVWYCFYALWGAFELCLLNNSLLCPMAHLWKGREVSEAIYDVSLVPIVCTGKGQQKPRVSGSWDPSHLALGEYICFNVYYRNILGNVSISVLIKFHLDSTNSWYFEADGSSSLKKKSCIWKIREE